jgi:hypothetical protein
MVCCFCRYKQHITPYDLDYYHSYYSDPLKLGIVVDVNVNCPKCGLMTLKEGPSSYFCSGVRCNFYLEKTQFNVTLPPVRFDLFEFCCQLRSQNICTRYDIASSVLFVFVQEKMLTLIKDKLVKIDVDIDGQKQQICLILDPFFHVTQTPS